MRAAVAATAVVAVSLVGAAGAGAWSGATGLPHGARPAHAGDRSGLDGQHRARQRRRHVGRRHAVIPKGVRGPGRRTHPAAPPSAGQPSGSPATAPGAAGPGSQADLPPAESGQPPRVVAGAGAPPAKTGAQPGPGTDEPTPGEEPNPPAGEEPNPPAGEEPEPPAGEEPNPPTGEEPQPPSGEEPEPPAGEEPKPPAGEEPEPPAGEEPKPPAGEPESPDPGDLLFNGRTIDDFAMVQAAPGAITEVPDPLGSGQTVLRMTVDDGDVAPVTPTENPRAQLVSPDLVEPGDEFWLKTKFLIPQDFPTVTGWMSLLSVYGPPFNASSPWQVEVIGDHLQWMRNRTYGFDVPWQEPLIKGAWVTVLTHERFAADGFVEMWIDGQQVSFFGRETRLEMKTADASNDGGSNSVRIAQYREVGMFKTGTLYFGPVLFGATRAAVGG